MVTHRATRFAAVPKAFAAFVLALLAIAMLFGATRDLPVPSVSSQATPDRIDIELYRAVAERVGQGEGYYPAVVAEQRERGYPLRPFVTVRLPTLAEIAGHAGLAATPFVLDAVTFAAWLAFVLRLLPRVSRIAWLAGSLALAVGMAVFLVPNVSFFHESWAGALIVLSLAVRSRDRWVASVLVGLAACAVRELALPYLLVMLVCALVDGTRREALGWSLAIGAFGLLLATHAAIVASMVMPHDAASPGWVAIGGWTFLLTALRFSPLLCLAPGWIVAVVVPLSLLGWVAWRDPIGLRGAFLLCGYALAFTVIGRANNSYWGLMIVPLLLVGLVFVPGALLDLARALRPARAPNLLTAAFETGA